MTKVFNLAASVLSSLYHGLCNNFGRFLLYLLYLATNSIIEIHSTVKKKITEEKAQLSRDGCRFIFLKGQDYSCVATVTNISFTKS